MSNNVQVLFPVARLVMGSLSEAQTKDRQGNPRVIKTGPNIGKPNPQYFFAIAIPKTPNDRGHWANTPWGQQIWNFGHAAWPRGEGQQPRFAWKIDDGDDATPNQNNRVNAKTEGFPGNWIVYLSSSFAPKTFNANGTEPVDAKLIKLGHYVEVFATVASNDNAQNPGVFINHNMVAYSGYGPEITRGPDPTAVGFGKGPLPAGASSVPVSALTPPPAGAPSAPPSHVAPPLPAAVASVPAPATPAPTAAPTPITPHPGVLVPTVAAPPAPAPVAPPAGPVWKGPPAGYAAHKAAGWSDDQLRQAGYI
jgi:hypothetical protein